MKWVAREKPKIDRIAYLWLITIFIDKSAEFLYVPSKDLLKVAEETGAAHHDISVVEITQVGDLYSFDAF